MLGSAPALKKLIFQGIDRLHCDNFGAIERHQVDPFGALGGHNTFVRLIVLVQPNELNIFLNIMKYPQNLGEIVLWLLSYNWIGKNESVKNACDPECHQGHSESDPWRHPAMIAEQRPANKNSDFHSGIPKIVSDYQFLLECAGRLEDWN